MLRSIVKCKWAFSRNTYKKYFSKPLKEFQYQIIKPPDVPSRIARPKYVTDLSPIFGKYEGKPLVHSKQAIQSPAIFMIELRQAAKVASKTLASTEKFIQEQAEKKNNITLEDIDKFVFDSIISQSAYPTPIGFMGFPKSVCASLNECIVHGIPSTRPLDKGDKINIDVTVYIDGYHGDNNLTLLYGESTHPQMNRIITLAQKALYKAISICKPGIFAILYIGVPFNRIGMILQSFAKDNAVQIVDDFAGHGVGELLHMPPQVLHKYHHKVTDVMEPGNVFTIQPIFTLNPPHPMYMWSDGFTVISPQNPNAQFEHTLLITSSGVQILTLRQTETLQNFN